MNISGIELSNPQKLLWKEPAITKLDLANYYKRIAQRILPHIVHRPLTLVRCPQGHRRGCFYQKHIHDSSPQAFKGIRVREKNNRYADYVSIQDQTGLIALVQQGVLEIHPWGSQENALNFPDRLIFDLDPGLSSSWEQLALGAVALQDELASCGLKSFLKTSGNKGLHVVVPLEPKATRVTIKRFAKAMTAKIVALDPSNFTDNMAKERRVGKIFIDFQRNSQGSTTVAPFSTRARAGCTISTPLFWEELDNKNLQPHSFNILNIEEHVKRDPWEGFFSIRQTLA